MTRDEMIARTMAFSKAVIGLCRDLPATREANLIAGQLFRAGTSVGANYCAACRGRSRADFIAKLGIVEEEADESLYWLTILMDMKIGPEDKERPLAREANEILSIIIASKRTARQNQ